MRKWSIPSDGPYTLKLAADVRFTPTDYVNDQIWELVLAYTDPPSVALCTGYGLRARDMRIFPGFVWNGTSVTDPAMFASPPRIHSVLPNYARIDMFPFEWLLATGEYWIRDSHSVFGRWTIHNQSDDPGKVDLRLYSLLHAKGDHEPMSDSTQQGVVILSGKVSELSPVIFLEGGVRSPAAAYPVLEVGQKLDRLETRSWNWAHVGEKDVSASFDRARVLVGTNWDSGTVEVKVAGDRIVDIETGDPDWDAAFWMAQKTAIAAYVGPTNRLPYPSIVETRGPDNGYSPKGNGTDYMDCWSGQDAFWAYPNFLDVIYAAPELPKGVIQNYFYTQDAEGQVDRKPGLAGQRSGLQCPPLLAAMVYRIYQHTEDRTFLRSVYPKLADFVASWNLQAHDRDMDGHPEWDHTIHSGFDAWPTFVRWNRWGQGYDISMAETPDLASYLYHEYRSMIDLAEELGESEHVAKYEEKARLLRESVEASWDGELSMYHHMDRDDHVSYTGELLGSGIGSFSLEVDREYEQPVRVLVRSVGPEAEAGKIKVVIHTRGPRGGRKIERLTFQKFQWFWTFGSATSDASAKAFDRIEVRGLDENFETRIWIPNLTRHDASSFLPLWAGIPHPERAKQLIESRMKDGGEFWREFGIPACSAQDPAYDPGTDSGTGEIFPLWNIMIGEGLLRYGRTLEAVDLVTKLMNVIITTLKEDHSHRKTYHPDRPLGFGKSDHILGGAPLDLFLSTLGVRLITPRKVQVWGQNLYPWPVRIRWMGLEILCENARKRIIFPDGQFVEILDGNFQVVEQLSERVELT